MFIEEGGRESFRSSISICIKQFLDGPGGLSGLGGVCRRLCWSRGASRPRAKTVGSTIGVAAISSAGWRIGMGVQNRDRRRGPEAARWRSRRPTPLVSECRSAGDRGRANGEIAERKSGGRGNPNRRFGAVCAESSLGGDVPCGRDGAERARLPLVSRVDSFGSAAECPGSSEHRARRGSHPRSRALSVHVVSAGGRSGGGCRRSDCHSRYLSQREDVEQDNEQASRQPVGFASEESIAA